MTPQEQLNQVAGLDMATDYVERAVVFVLFLACLIGVWVMIGIAELFIILRRGLRNRR
jgi:hypothetical protein